MSMSVKRHLAIATCASLQRILPARLQPWGWAVRSEVAAIPEDGPALLFALQSVCGLTPRAIAIHWLSVSAKLTSRDAISSGGMINMSFFKDMAHRPRQVGIACAIGAVMLGLTYMMFAGAPIAYLGVNMGALAVGLMCLALLSRFETGRETWSGVITLVMAFALLATALVGERVEGAARWVDLGVLFVQPSLILLPVMIVGFACARNALSTIGLVVAAIALAIQPDRAMAGMLMAGLAALAVFRRDRFTIPALILSVIGFVATLAQADTLPAVPFVDQIFYTSFETGLIAGLAVLGGAILLIVPAIIGGACDKDNRQIYSVFGLVWLTAIAAAALGNYPTPVVGYSGGAVLGYVLSLAMLPRVARSRASIEQAPESQRVSAESTNQSWRAALA